ncbi:MAG: hypothetical protein LBL52_04195 [Rickettsiales bacterium]|nr:hypothetical protein [Rickettsiales bacterium]
MTRKDIRGASMVELLLYIGIIITVTLAGVKFQSQAIEKTRQAELQMTLSDAEKKINELYLGRPWGTMTEGERAKYLLERGVSLTSPWKSGMQDYGTGANGRKLLGNMTVSTSDGISSNSAIRMPHFAVHVKNLPRPSCIWVATSQSSVAACVSVNNAVAVSETDCIREIGTATSRCDRDNNEVIVFFRKE